MKRAKPWWKSKTLYVNALLAAGTVAEAHFGLLQAAMGPKAYLVGMAVIAGVNAFLRTISSEALTLKATPEANRPAA